MGCCIDVGHVARKLALTWLKLSAQVGPRLFNVHAKDLTNLPKQREPSPRWRRHHAHASKMFEALIAMKYSGFVDLEYEIHADDPMPGAIGKLCLYARRSRRPRA